MSGALHGRLFRFPDFFQVRELLLQFGDLGFQGFETLLRSLVGFLLQRLALDLELNDAPVQGIHILGHGIDLHADA